MLLPYAYVAPVRVLGAKMLTSPTGLGDPIIPQKAKTRCFQQVMQRATFKDSWTQNDHR